MSLDLELSNMLQAIPECVATGVVDIQTGMLLGVRAVENQPQEVLDLVAAATGELFQGPTVLAVEAAFKKMRDVTDDHHYFQEIIILSDKLINVFQRGKQQKDIVVVLVCHNSANLGMVLSKAHLALPAIEAAF